MTTINKLTIQAKDLKVLVHLVREGVQLLGEMKVRDKANRVRHQ